MTKTALLGAAQLLKLSKIYSLQFLPKFVLNFYFKGLRSKSATFEHFKTLTLTIFFYTSDNFKQLVKVPKNVIKNPKIDQGSEINY